MKISNYIAFCLHPPLNILPQMTKISPNNLKVSGVHYSRTVLVGRFLTRGASFHLSSVINDPHGQHVSIVISLLRIRQQAI